LVEAAICCSFRHVRFRRAGIHIIRQNAEFHSGVDSGCFDPSRESESAEGHVQDSGNAGLNEFVGDLLGGVGGHGEDRHSDVAAAELFQFRERLDLEVCDFAADLPWGFVENGGDLEAVHFEAFEEDQCASEFAGTYEGDAGGVLDAEDISNSLYERIDFVADAWRSECSEIGQVFTDLG